VFWLCYPPSKYLQNTFTPPASTSNRLAQGSVVYGQISAHWEKSCAAVLALTTTEIL